MVGANGSIEERSTRSRLTADLVLRWLPPLLFAGATWAVFQDSGWIAWLAAIPAAYVGRAAADLAAAGSHRIESGAPQG